VQYCALFCVSPGTKSCSFCVSSCTKPCSFLRFFVHQKPCSFPRFLVFQFRRLPNCALFCGVSPCTFASSPKKIYKELLYVIKEQKVALLVQASVIFCKILRAPNGALNHATVIQAMGHGPQLYAQTLLHRHFYTQTLLHAAAFTQMPLHTAAFTHRHFYTQPLLHTDTFTQGRFYTDAFAHKRFHTHNCRIMLGNLL
jgi:hypothetical protein